MVLPSDSGAQPFPGERKQILWLTLFGLIVALGTLVSGTYALVASREATFSQAKHNAENLLTALDRDIGRNVAILDLSLRGLIDTLKVPGIAEVNPDIRQRALFDSSSSAEDLGSVLILDKQGDITADSTNVIPRDFNFADRDYFKIHQEEPRAGLFLSRVFTSRVADGDLRLAISRRIDGRHGEFEGVVLATLRLTYFRRLFERLNIGKNGSISIIRSDGRMLFRHPFRNKDVDTSLAGSANFARFSQSQSGQYVGFAAVDGVERLYTYRQVGDLPIKLFVSLSTEEIFAPWRQSAVVIGSAMLVLCASAVASSCLFHREMLRRAKSERALAAAAQQLAVLASTDGLTGLMNRRAFDAELERVYRSAIRTGASLAVLMIDADQFKRFNDTYGHPAGDGVLRAVATTMRAHIRRASDVIARYGGEEFVAFLPDTDIDSAIVLGERVRLAVKQLGIRHSGSPIGVVSISIGVAATSPLIGDTPATLLASADRGLYAAKASGRDCVRRAEPDAASGPDLIAIANAANVSHISLARRA